MEQAIQQINEFLKKHNWCDFEIINLKGNLTIGGRTGFSEKYDIQITFEDVFFMQCLYEWRTDINISKEIISLANVEENNYYNYNYEIEQGYELFKILAENIKQPLYVSARNIKFEILN